MIFGVYMCTPRTRPEHHLRTLAYVCVCAQNSARPGEGGGVADNVTLRGVQQSSIDLHKSQGSVAAICTIEYLDFVKELAPVNTFRTNAPCGCIHEKQGMYVRMYVHTYVRRAWRPSPPPHPQRQRAREREMRAHCHAKHMTPSAARGRSAATARVARTCPPRRPSRPGCNCRCASKPGGNGPVEESKRCFRPNSQHGRHVACTRRASVEPHVASTNNPCPCMLVNAPTTHAPLETPHVRM